MPPLPLPYFIPQNSGKIVVLQVLHLLSALNFIKYVKYTLVKILIEWLQLGFYPIV